MKDIRNVYRIFVSEPGKEGPSERLRFLLWDNIKIDLKEIVCEDVSWIHLAHTRSIGQLLSTWYSIFGSCKGREFLDHHVE
jgi:hypothetical protein